MSYAERHSITVTTDSGGDGTGYSPIITGRIESVQYVKTDYANGVDFTITLEATGENIWTDTDVNASEIVAPRRPVHTQAGAAINYAATFPVHDHIIAAQDRVKIVVGSGGETKTGEFIVTIR